MYQYDESDQNLIDQRVAEFRGQVARRLAGEISEDEFKPLRLMNGVYLQLHAYMVRVAIPYGVLSAPQLRRLADISERYDKGYGHFTTRQNIQFNWVRLDEMSDLLAALAEVQMHAIQTSGNCIRNITTDAFAGVAADEEVDPRVLCEILRQWSTLHPEFAYLPRKFKFAVTGAREDRAAIKWHDIGLHLRRNKLVDNDVQLESTSADNSSLAATVVDLWVGGGQGRTPKVAKLLRRDIPLQELLPYLDAVLRIYNLYGRRDNKYKARIKILVAELGLDEFRRRVDAEFDRITSVTDKAASEADHTRSKVNSSEATSIEVISSSETHLSEQPVSDQRVIDSTYPEIEQLWTQVAARFQDPPYLAAPVSADNIRVTLAALPDGEILQRCGVDSTTALDDSAEFLRWCRTNTSPHQHADHVVVQVSLKSPGGIPGDADATQMRVLADVAEQYSASELRVSHRQNLVLPHVGWSDLWSLWQRLRPHQLATPNIDTVTDIIACPGLDYCALATARSIPVAQQLSTALSNPDPDCGGSAGNLSLNISGCINACAHHHVADIGILGLNRAGVENYQITLGGRNDAQARAGERMGPGLRAADLVPAVERVVQLYFDRRLPDERFSATYDRVGKDSFKQVVYDAGESTADARYSESDFARETDNAPA